GGGRPVTDLDGAQLAVEGGHHGAQAALVGVADRLELDEQPDAGVEVDGVLLARAQAVEEVLAVEDAGVAEAAAVGFELAGGAGEEQPVEGRSAVLGEAGAVVGAQFLDRL